MNALPTLWHGFSKGLKRFGNGTAAIVNSILLAIVYIFGVGLTSLIAKLVGKRFLHLHTSRKAKTYWEDIKHKERPMEEHYRQF